jgi:hypothetical protein
VLAVDGRKASDAWLTPRPTGGVPDSSGQVADSVRLEVARLAQGDTTEVTVVRARWRPPSVPEALLAAEGVGYARLTSAASGSAEELERAVEGLLDRGARSLVLDLRGNMGGLFEEGIKVASLFLERGLVVASLEHRGATGLQSQIARGSRWPSLPLAVLVDQHTASSAELIAAALRDHGRALLVGEHTYGKGLVQRVVALNGQMSLRMTTARWLPPSGEPITRREEKNGQVTGGLAPDVLVTPAGRLDVAAVPATLSPAMARTLSDAVDGVVLRAMQDGWSGAPLPLLERRSRDLLEAGLSATVPDSLRRAALVGDGTRVSVRRLLEMTREDEAVWSYAALDDAAFRAALDVVAPGLSTAAPVATAEAAGRVAARDTLPNDSLMVERLRLWTERRFAGRRLDGAAADSGASSRPSARIDGRLRAATADTLVALHFAGSPFQPAHAPGARVRLADPSGLPTAIEARVVARLPFRAPVVPSALTWRGAEWRHGWAYLVVLPGSSAAVHPGGFAGWRLAPMPAKAVRVAARTR